MGTCPILLGNVIGSFAEGLYSPNNTSATPYPPLVPGNHISKIASVIVSSSDKSKGRRSLKLKLSVYLGLLFSKL